MTITSADGTKLAARCSGHGSPLVLVHGANGDLDTFALIEDALARHHAVWVYSRRGRGGSGDGPGYALEREVEDVRAVSPSRATEPILPDTRAAPSTASWPPMRRRCCHRWCSTSRPSTSNASTRA